MIDSGKPNSTPDSFKRESLSQSTSQSNVQALPRLSCDFPISPRKELIDFHDKKEQCVIDQKAEACARQTEDMLSFGHR